MGDRRESKGERIEGFARLGRRTKELVTRLRPGDVAVIDHEDLDVLAAEALCQARPAAVVNAKSSISGSFPNEGPSVLLARGLPLLDAVGEGIFERLRDGDPVRIEGCLLLDRAGRVIARGVRLEEEAVRVRLARARANLAWVLERFVDNTLEHARRERHLITTPFPLPPLRTRLRARPVVIVVRGHGYREDLQAIGSFIEEARPVLIGVDGGADALLEMGWRPDLIVGDMDSVSDQALRCGAELVAHAYPDGRCPALERLRTMGIPAHTLAAPGTSEDVAMLLAYRLGATLLVAVGTHSNLIDFLEKGRAGMASTFLVRLLVGPILVDARGASRLYRGRTHPRYLAVLAGAATVPALAVGLLSEPIRQLIQLLWLALRVHLGTS